MGGIPSSGMASRESIIIPGHEMVGDMEAVTWAAANTRRAEKESVNSQDT